MQRASGLRYLCVSDVAVAFVKFPLAHSQFLVNTTNCGYFKYPNKIRDHTLNMLFNTLRIYVMTNYFASGMTLYPILS